MADELHLYMNLFNPLKIHTVTEIAPRQSRSHKCSNPFELLNVNLYWFTPAAAAAHTHTVQGVC